MYIHVAHSGMVQNLDSGLDSAVIIIIIMQ